MGNPSGDVPMSDDPELRPTLRSVEMEERHVFVEELSSTVDAQPSVAFELCLREAVHYPDLADGSGPTAAVARSGSLSERVMMFTSQVGHINSFTPSRAYEKYIRSSPRR
jgi:hypothetical protein